MLVKHQPSALDLYARPADLVTFSISLIPLILKPLSRLH